MLEICHLNNFMRQEHLPMPSDHIVFLERTLPLLHEHQNAHELRTKFLNDAQHKFQKDMNKVWAMSLDLHTETNDFSM